MYIHFSLLLSICNWLLSYPSVHDQEPFLEPGLDMIALTFILACTPHAQQYSNFAGSQETEVHKGSPQGKSHRKVAIRAPNTEHQKTQTES